MAKSFAYTSQWGGYSDKVTAKQVERRRLNEFNGQPTGQSFYSSHKPGSRKPVKHVMKGDTSFFAYINSEGTCGGVGGESLNHQLFKEALLTIETTRLSLIFNSGTRAQRQENITVQFTHAESEKRLVTAAQGHRCVDVYLKFETDSHIGRKWEGELHLEVRSTHAVDAEKQTELRALSVPVVEVDIPEIFIYKFSDERTTDEREAAHKMFIKNVLEGPKGFLKCVVLSNPSSKPYLEEQVVLLQKTLNEQRIKSAELEGTCTELSQRLEVANNALSVSEANGVTLQAQLRALNDRHTMTSRQFITANNTLGETEAAYLQSRAEISQLTETLEKRTDEQKNTLEAFNKLKVAFNALAQQKQRYVVRSRRLGIALACLLIIGCGTAWLFASSVNMSNVFKQASGALAWF
ncbi:hypothetical protein [Pseudomonas fluorescens]|uniref:Uncharacterized protein n=1 Tax=Pseudomonas fluorescens TaxID=294 RepID=A0A423LVL2_PSEFL|nr:hypothetical protein [Pseudomonas fluorescens]RON72356.1 hypothetical protein BK671_00430 [Pseudomonas fluorescens]